MSVMRINKNKNYTVMSNHHLRNKNLTLKAKGLLSVMLSLPDKWDYSISGLCSICKENETAIKTALGELREQGYVVVTKKMPDKNENRSKIEYIYDIYEEPQCKKDQQKENQDKDNQGVENLGVDNQQVEKPTQLNTYKSTKEKENTDFKNTDKINTEILNTDSEEEQEEKKGRNNSENCKVETSVPKKQKHTHKKSKYETYLELKEKEKDMLNRVYDICRKDHSLSEDTSLEVVKIIDYYLSKYTQKTGNIHPILGNKALSDIISVLYDTVDTEYGHFENLVEDDGYMDIIDEFFKTDFGQRTGERTDYHLSHFATDGVISRLAQRLV